jgi:hypothetical protein
MDFRKVTSDTINYIPWLTLTAKFSVTMDKIYLLTFKEFTITIATTFFFIVYQIVSDISETMTNLDIVLQAMLLCPLVVYCSRILFSLINFT